MRKLTGTIALFVLVGVGIAGVVLYVRAHPRSAKPHKPSTLPAYPGAVVKGLNLLQLMDEDTGKVQWEIRGVERIELPNSGAIVFQKLGKATYFEGGKEKLSVSAKFFRYNPTTQNFEVGGKVTVMGYLSMTVTTELVRWAAQEQRVLCPGDVHVFLKQLHFQTRRVEIYPKTSKLVCPNPVRLAGPASLVTGSRLEANLATEAVDLDGPIRFRARVGEDKRPFVL